MDRQREALESLTNYKLGTSYHPGNLAYENA
jgi:hypothetical protein